MLSRLNKGFLVSVLVLIYKWKDDMKYTGYELEQVCTKG